MYSLLAIVTLGLHSFYPFEITPMYIQSVQALVRSLYGNPGKISRTILDMLKTIKFIQSGL